MPRTHIHAIEWALTKNTSISSIDTLSRQKSEVEKSVKMDKSKTKTALWVSAIAGILTGTLATALLDHFIAWTTTELDKDIRSQTYLFYVDKEPTLMRTMKVCYDQGSAEYIYVAQGMGTYSDSADGTKTPTPINFGRTLLRKNDCVHLGGYAIWAKLDTLPTESPRTNEDCTHETAKGFCKASCERSIKNADPKKIKPCTARIRFSLYGLSNQAGRPEG